MKPARIDTVPGLKEEVARAYAENATQEQIAEIAGVKDRGTVAEWLKREDVQQLCQKFIMERSNRILRATDTRIERKLQAETDISLERLLKIRQTFAGQQVKLDLSGDQAGILQDFLNHLHENPAAAESIAGALKGDADTD